MNLSTTSGAVRVLSLLMLSAAVVAAGCEEEPFGFIDWSAVPDTVALYSLARPELLGLPSAFDFANDDAGAVTVETPSATGEWDVVLTEQDGVFLLAPAGAFPAISAGAGIATLEDVIFEDVAEAPGDTAAYDRNDPVTIRTDVVYVVKSRPVPGFYGITCVRFAKLDPIELDATDGTFRFAYVQNPNCNDRTLVGSEED